MDTIILEEKKSAANDGKEKIQIDAHMVHNMFSLWDKEVPSVEDLRTYFTDDMIFEDPLQRIEGLEAYREMNERLLKKNADLIIEMREHAQNGPHIMFTFSLSMAPNKKRPQRKAYVEGMTYVRLNEEGKIDYHRDYWDFAPMFLGMFPAPILRLYKRFTAKLG